MSLCRHCSEGHNVQKKHLALPSHQLLYAGIPNGADSSCKQTMNIYLFLLTQHSVVHWKLVPLEYSLVKTLLFFHLVTSVAVTSCCYLKMWWEECKCFRHGERAFGSVVPEHPSASLKDKSFEVNIKSLGVCAWFKFQALYLWREKGNSSSRETWSLIKVLCLQWMCCFLGLLLTNSLTVKLVQSASFCKFLQK